jgi:hypothetical protein
MKFNFLSFFRKASSDEVFDELILVDGDQYNKRHILYYDNYLRGKKVEWFTCLLTHPKKLKCREWIKIVELNNFRRTGKETVDKGIGIRIQQAIDSGVRKICVISNDMDYIDIFGMVQKLNPDKFLEFRLIIDKDVIVKRLNGLNINVEYMSESV